MSKHKFYVALSGFLTLLGGSLADGSLSSSEGLALVAAAVTAAGVFFVPNKPVA